MFAFILPILLSAHANQIHRETFISDCFKNYVELYSRPITKDPTAQKKSEKDFKRFQQKCLSSAFRKSWPQAVLQTGADPLLLAQDFNEDWRNHISVTRLTETEVQVELGKQSKHCLIASTFSKKTMQISDVHPCPQR